MPLTIKTDVPNTTDATNKAHYALAVTLMAAGVPSIRKDNVDDLSKLVARVILLDTFPRMDGVRMTPESFLAWVRSFGNISTNAGALTINVIMRGARDNAEQVAAAVCSVVGREPVKAGAE